MRTFDDPITQIKLRLLNDEIKCSTGETKKDFQQLKYHLQTECALFEQSIKDKTNGN